MRIQTRSAERKSESVAKQATSRSATGAHQWRMLKPNRASNGLLLAVGFAPMHGKSVHLALRRDVWAAPQAEPGFARREPHKRPWIAAQKEGSHRGTMGSPMAYFLYAYLILPSETSSSAIVR